MALRIPSAICSGLAPVAVVASVTVCAMSENDSKFKMRTVSFQWEKHREKKFLVIITYRRMRVPKPSMRSVRLPYLCSPDWRTAPRYCVPPFRHATNHKMLALHALTHSRLTDVVWQIYLECCQRTRCVHSFVRSSSGVRLDIMTKKNQVYCFVKPQVSSEQLVYKPLVRATAPK